MNQETLDLFKTLTEFPAAPGFERELRAYVKDAMTPYTEEFVQDRLEVCSAYCAVRKTGQKLWSLDILTKWALWSPELLTPG